MTTRLSEAFYLHFVHLHPFFHYFISNPVHSSHLSFITRPAVLHLIRIQFPHFRTSPPLFSHPSAQFAVVSNVHPSSSTDHQCHPHFLCCATSRWFPLQLPSDKLTSSLLP